MGPAVPLLVVGGRGPDPGRGLLQLDEGLELGQLQQLRLRLGIGHRRRRHLDGLALGEAPARNLSSVAGRLFMASAASSRSTAWRTEEPVASAMR